MLSGEWLGPWKARSIRSPPISRVRLSWKVSSFGGLAGSLSRSRSVPRFLVPDAGHVLVEQRRRADVVGVVVRVDEVLDLVADAVRGGDLVDRALDVVPERRRRVEHDDAVRGRQERRHVGAVRDVVEVPLDSADVVALLVEGRAERRARDRRVVGQGGRVGCAHAFTPSVAMVARASSRSKIRPWSSPSGPSIRPASETPPTFNGSKPAALIRRWAVASAASSSVA